MRVPTPHPSMRPKRNDWEKKDPERERQEQRKRLIEEPYYKSYGMGWGEWFAWIATMIALILAGFLSHELPCYENFKLWEYLLGK